MSFPIRAALALAGGIAAGILTMVVLQHFFPFQPPAGVDYSSGKPFNAWVGSLSNHAYIMMLTSFLTGSLAGGLITRTIALRPAPFPLELMVGFALLFYSIVTFQAAPTPAWLTYISAPGCIALAWLGGWIARRLWKSYYLVG